MEVSKLRREGVRAFPIVMDSQINTGLIAIVGCMPPRSYLGGLDDTLAIVSDLSEEKKEKISRESLWQQCK